MVGVIVDSHRYDSHTLHGFDFRTPHNLYSWFPCTLPVVCAIAQPRSHAEMQLDTGIAGLDLVYGFALGIPLLECKRDHSSSPVQTELRNKVDNTLTTR